LAATVVQWIELSPPKGVIQVRFLSGAPTKVIFENAFSIIENSYRIPLCNFELILAILASYSDS